MRVAAIGECMLELSGSGSEWHMGHAGDTLNTLWALRALIAEAETDYVTAFGDDPFSAAQRGFLADAGIGTAASPVIAGARPGLYAITLEGAERSFTYWRSDSAARRLADDRARLDESVAGAWLVYFSGITLAILDARGRSNLLGALAGARSAGALVAFDPNHRPRLWEHADAARDAIGRALAITDIALPTFEDEKGLFGDESPHQTVARMRDAGVGEIAVKNGAEAALVAAAGKDPVEVPAMAVDAVDTTGAGDAFNGGYLAARLLGQSPKDAARAGHRTAAATVGIRGALAPAATLRSAFKG